MTEQRSTCRDCGHADHEGRVCGEYVFIQAELRTDLCVCGLEDEECEQ